MSDARKDSRPDLAATSDQINVDLDLGRVALNDAHITVTRTPHGDRDHNHRIKEADQAHQHRMEFWKLCIGGVTGVLLLGGIAGVSIAVILSSGDSENKKQAWSALTAALTALLGFLAGRASK